MRLGARAAALVGALSLACGGAPPRPTSAAAPAWRAASEEAFAEAAREDRLVLLSVQADWCHWCHVMNATTFADPDVRRLLDEGFVTVRAEEGARPDLAERYGNWGWPATIVFAPDGTEILRLRGYRDPVAMRAILETLLADLRAHAPLGATLEGHVAPSGSEAPRELAEARAIVRAQLDGLYDRREGGWGDEQRYPFDALVRHALVRGREEGDARATERGLRSLARYTELIDPVDGGMYQYSDGDWAHPHYEKLAEIQAGAIEALAEAYASTHDERWVRAAGELTRYLDTTLTSPDGTFYASQDADLRSDESLVPGAVYYALDAGERRARGTPRIDTHVYASVGGRLAAALARWGAVRADAEAVHRAERCVRAIDSAQRDERGLYLHEASESDDGVRYLADQAEMLRALVALHQATGDPTWAVAASALADRTLEVLGDEASHALFSRTPGRDPTEAPTLPIEDGAVVARMLLALSVIEHRPDRVEQARAILGGLASPRALAAAGRKVGEYAIALELSAQDPVALTVVGDPAAAATGRLVRAAVDYAEPRAVLVWQTSEEGEYPFDPGTPALYVCSSVSCSEPITDPARVRERLDAFFERE